MLVFCVSMLCSNLFLKFLLLSAAARWTVCCIKADTRRWKLFLPLLYVFIPGSNYHLCCNFLKRITICNLISLFFWLLGTYPRDTRQGWGWSHHDKNRAMQENTLIPWIHWVYLWGLLLCKFCLMVLYYILLLFSLLLFIVLRKVIMLNPKSQRSCLWVCLMICYSFFLHDFAISA
jgi:hypothetical protein